MKNNQYDKIFEKKCDVCGRTLLASKTGNGECQYCGWYNNRLGEINENEVIFPNLVSLNKAKRLYQEGKPFRPDLNDFLEGLYFYSEMEFWYKGLNCCLYLRSNTNKKIEFGWSPENVYFFLDKEDFIQNAKIGGEFVKDIWNKVENPKYI